MRTLTAFLCLTFAVLLFSAGEGFALPPCPEDQNQRFHNCFGTYTKSDASKHVGEWRDDKQRNGTDYSADGIVRGTYVNGKWHPGSNTSKTTTSTASEKEQRLKTEEKARKAEGFRPVRSTF